MPPIRVEVTGCNNCPFAVQIVEGSWCQHPIKRGPPDISKECFSSGTLPKNCPLDELVIVKSVAQVPRIISSFRGEYNWLSNFYSCPVSYEEMTFPSTEHAYQAAKTLDAKQRTAFQLISAKEAKALGNKIAKRPDWEQVKLSVMEQLLIQKFDCNTTLGNKLKDTGNAMIIEGNYWHDNYYGACTCSKCGGIGRNELGNLLMKIRGLL